MGSSYAPHQPHPKLWYIGTLLQAWTSCTRRHQRQAIVYDIAKIVSQISETEAQELPDKDADTMSVSTSVFGRLQRWLGC